MRAITKETLNAWMNGNSFTKSNTCVTKEGAVFLHGNQIIKVIKGVGVFASDGGYGWTSTTAERLKPWCRFQKIKGVPHIDGKPYETGTWVCVEPYSFPKLGKGENTIGKPSEALYGC